MSNDAISRSEVLEVLENHSADDLLYQSEYEGFKSDINAIPALDVAPVVRCKSCMKRSTFECPMYSEVDGSDYGLGIIINDRTDDDGYCHCGARMAVRRNEESD